MATFGKAKKSGAPRKAPKVAAPKPANGNYMREAGMQDKKGGGFIPKKNHRLSK